MENVRRINILYCRDIHVISVKVESFEVNFVFQDKSTEKHIILFGVLSNLFKCYIDLLILVEN